ncbi:MAG: hypothetical protein C4520_04420 [Candidatus Abyssobacteria bacterium SURF_5]|uniref:DUF4878 domain-containing protein n=1 Tax=Abyssobacteria bacterium (strain SURF_5) TaxID=2093360 RepID=A0A3A4NZ57_ABYX5|nr:MAG: hypothetical protein C4520_04420 [Candidatus Abyssubacteria bacterium SURF_5]
MGIEVKWPEKKEARKPPSKKAKKPAKVSAVKFPVLLGAAFLVLMAVAIVFLRLKPLSSNRPPDEVAAAALGALSAGIKDDFLRHVDIRTFVSQMDSTGVTRRDYAQANWRRKRELESVHAQLLSEDIFVGENTGKSYEIIGKDIKETSAVIMIRPWIQCGNKLYKRLVLEKRTHGWKITGLASPDA